MFKILFFGDVVGAPGRKGLRAVLPDLRAEYAPDLVIANVENLSHGQGVSAKSLKELDDIGVDAYTSGNHVWGNQAGLSCFTDPAWKGRLIRPANVQPHLAGTGSMVIEKNGQRLLVINLLGTLFMKDQVENPFLCFDSLIADAPKMVLVDFHTETTSEKEALGHYADGRASAVLGSHTHVPTADTKILPGGTAFQTDVGRCGAHDSVVGYEKNSATKAFFPPFKRMYDLQKSGTVEVNAVCVSIDPETGKALALDRIRKIVDT